MKQLVFKLFFVPFVAFFAMMFTVAILGSIYDINWLKQNLNGSGITVWYAWLAVLTPAVVLHHYLKSNK